MKKILKILGVVIIGFIGMFVLLLGLGKVAEKDSQKQQVETTKTEEDTKYEMLATLNHLIDKQAKYANDSFLVELVNSDRSEAEVDTENKQITIKITFNELVEKRMDGTTMKNWTEGTKQDWDEIVEELYPDYKVQVKYYTHWE